MTVAALPRIPSESRRERVVQILRDAITSGQLLPGHRLIELELASQLGTSRAPIREALRQLEQEGLVASYPYRGSEVVGVSQEEIDEVLVPVRLTLERFAFRRALPLLTDEDFTELARWIGEMRGGADTGDADRMADADLRFHELVITRSGQAHCLQMWRTIQPRVRAYFRRDAPAHDTPHSVAEQHERLLLALRSGEEQQVLDAVDEHIHIHLTPETESALER